MQKENKITRRISKLRMGDYIEIIFNDTKGRKGIFVFLRTYRTPVYKYRLFGKKRLIKEIETMEVNWLDGSWFQDISLEKIKDIRKLEI